jgi:hypothetical protein
MAVVNPFINIFRTKEEAFYFKNSQINTQFIFKGVQLLPNDTSKYIQVTQTVGGLNIEDWQVNVVNLCSGIKTDITNSFNVESVTNDLDGAPQIYWSLLNIPIDFGYDLICLEINQDFGETFYTSPFMITSIESSLTTQFHYKENKDAVYQSIRLQSWYFDEDEKTELITYYELQTNTTVTKSLTTNYLHIHRTELMPKNIIILLGRLLVSGILYVDGVRCSLYEAIEIPAKTTQENFTSITFTLSPKLNDLFFGKADYSGIDYGTDYFI